MKWEKNTEKIGFGKIQKGKEERAELSGFAAAQTFFTPYLNRQANDRGG